MIPAKSDQAIELDARKENMGKEDDDNDGSALQICLYLLRMAAAGKERLTA